MNRKTWLSFVCMCLLCGVKAQLQQLDSMLAVYSEKVPSEKLHIQFDNSRYVPGETVWYKAYLKKGSEPSDLSKNLYIDCFDENGKLLNRVVAPIVNAITYGNFTIPEQIQGSRLQILAYTRWMLNFDSAFLFRKNLQVIHKNKIDNITAASVPVTTLTLFPEGGDLVENITSTLAFKANNSEGMPVAVKGRILNNSKEEVTAFATTHNGMGTVAFMPKPGEQYTAEWIDPQGTLRRTALPPAQHSGLVLRISQSMGKRLFSIERSKDAEPRLQKISVVATMHDQLLLSAKVNLLNKTSTTTALPITGFASGIVQLTLFDANQQPVAERIFFINDTKYTVAAELVADTLNLNKRGKNVYQISIPDTVIASLSVSVTDGDAISDQSHTILSQLLLSSELRGYIHNPAYYVSSDADSVAAHLDLLMLTHGWRRFVWKDVFTGKTPALPYTHDTGYLSIAGKIDKLSDTKIKKAETLNLIIAAKDSSRQMIFTPLQPDGSFRENNLILFDTVKVYYQLNNTFLPARSSVKINNTFLPYDSARKVRTLAQYLPDTTGMARINAIETEKRRIEKLMMETTLQEVVVTAKLKTRIQEMDEKYTRSAFFQGGNAKTFNLVDDITSASSPSVFSYLQSRVAGLQITNAFSQNPSATRRGSPVAFFMNEMSVDAAMLSSLSMAEIAYVKVFDPPFFAAVGGGAGGAIAVYTRVGNDDKIVEKGLDYTTLPGYSPIKQFYSPDYSDKGIRSSQPDFRRTLYWQPNLSYTGDGKKINFSFYNNDISRNLRVTIEGMTQEGKLIHISKLLQ